MKKALGFGILHFGIDFLSLMIFYLATWAGNGFFGENNYIPFLALSIYIVFAFLFQGPVGLLLDHTNGKLDSYLFLLSPLLILIGILPIFFLNTYTIPLTLGLSLPLAGIGNCLFHVTVGRRLMEEKASAGELGVFISFGAIAVALTSSDLIRNEFILLINLILYFLFLFISLIAFPILFYYWMQNQIKREDIAGISVMPSFKEGALLLLLLALSVFLRGLMGSYKSGESVAYAFLYTSIGIFLGKLLGGILVDRFGAFPLIGTSLLFAILGYSLSGLSTPIPMMVFSAFSVNLFMGLTLYCSGQAFRECKGFTFGILSTFLGFGAFLGTVFTSLFQANYFSLIMAIMNFLLIGLTLYFLVKSYGKNGKAILEYAKVPSFLDNSRR